MEEKNQKNSIQENSPAGEFLQSEDWRRFQESVGRKTFHFLGENFRANIILHTLPIVGKYFYVPRGPVISDQESVNSEQEIKKLIKLAKENDASWIRIDPANEEILKNIKAGTSNVHYGHLMSGGVSIAKAPHDVQPKEIFVIDLAKSEEDLLAEMKPKARYNVRLAEKRGVDVFVMTKMQNTRYKQNPKSKFPTLPTGRQVSNQAQNQDDKKFEQYVDEFIRLTAVMAKRQGIVAHPAEYYRKMLEIIPGDILKLYVAEYEGKVIAANLVVFYGDTCIYLHGASDDEFRNVMAPYLLQWRQIQDAKKAGCVRYDFGGVSTNYESNTNIRITNKWEGITKFKTGFSPQTSPTVRLGSYDVVISPLKYWTYRCIQKAKNFLR
ncbi:MAG: peptidoglycan bridge formation glycyltransferase FemA/FemB family protein [Candidatus Moranbacteria bacterium]|nr:peptidoglycan bridge formation glycyltransferase FemA/FemB family protein [Candidatus Moranbacteria bacterium]